ncbi:MAG: hypothetical protein V3S46_07835 [Nitrospinota bacterium]
MEKVGAYAAKTHLSSLFSLLDKDAKGERIIITKHGISTAEMIYIISTKTSDPKVILF